MRRFEHFGIFAIAFAVVVAAWACAATRTPAVAATVVHADAPADEYFGAQRMSALGIRMRVDALGRRYHARTIADDDLVHDASIAEASFFAWQARYPHDTWLAPTAFHLEQLFQAVQSADARTEATRLLHVVASTYPATRYAHLARVRLAAGFPALTAESAVRSTPSPYGSPDASTASATTPAPSPASSTSPAGATPEPSHR